MTWSRLLSSCLFVCLFVIGVEFWRSEFHSAFIIIESHSIIIHDDCMVILTLEERPSRGVRRLAVAAPSSPLDQTASTKQQQKLGRACTSVLPARASTRTTVAPMPHNRASSAEADILLYCPLFWVCLRSFRHECLVMCELSFVCLYAFIGVRGEFSANGVLASLPLHCG